MLGGALETALETALEPGRETGQETDRETDRVRSSGGQVPVMCSGRIGTLGSGLPTA